MHSISSMPRHSSQAVASFQFFTPLWDLMKAGTRARLERTSFFAGGIIHHGIGNDEVMPRPHHEGKGSRSAPALENGRRAIRLTTSSRKRMDSMSGTRLTTIGFDADDTLWQNEQ